MTKRCVVNARTGRGVSDNLGKAPTAAEVAAQEKFATRANLAVLDSGYVRVLEDLIDLLVAKGTISLADLPQAARDKHAARKAERAKL